MTFSITLVRQCYQTIQSMECVTDFANASQNCLLIRYVVVCFTTQNLCDSIHSTLDRWLVNHIVVGCKHVNSCSSLGFLVERLKDTELEVIQAGIILHINSRVPTGHFDHVTVDFRGLRVDHVRSQTNTLWFPYRAPKVQGLFQAIGGHVINHLRYEGTEVIYLLFQTIVLGITPSEVFNVSRSISSRDNPSDFVQCRL